MKVFKCDRCGAFFEPYYKSNGYTGSFCVATYRRAIYSDSGIENSYELCPKCKESFDIWLNDELQDMFKNDKEVGK